MSHKIYEVGDYSSSETEEKEDSNSDSDIVLAVRRGGNRNSKPVFTSVSNSKATTGNTSDTNRPVTRRTEFSNDYEEEEKEDVVHMKHGRQHAGNVVPAVANLEAAEAVGLQKSKPKETEKKKNISKGLHKGQSLTSDDAVAFMIKERQALDEEFAVMRRENNKLKQGLKIKQEQTVIQKVVTDPNSKKQQADLENLKQENLALKRKKVEMEYLLRAKAAESPPKATQQPVQKKSRGKANKAREVSESSSGSGSSESGSSSSESEQKPKRKQQVKQRSQKHQPVKEKKPSPRKGVAAPAGVSATHVKKGSTSNAESLPLTGKKFNSLPSVLWEGGKLWKIPYNGKGMPEERMVMIKRALRPGPQARPVRVLSKGEESSDGAVSVPVAYVAYPPAIIWYDAEKPNEAKFAREIALIEGAYLVDGHQTPAFWKLVNRGAPMPPKELCFSIVTSNRTLDLAAETLKEANIWKNAIHMLLVMMTTSKDWGMQNLRRETPTWHHDSMLKETAANVKQSKGAPANGEVAVPPPSKSAKSGVMKEQMFTATRLNNFSALDDLLRNGVPVNLMEADTGDTPLMVACRKNYPVIAKLCLDYGAKNDPHPDFGQTSLHAAVAAAAYDCVDVLLDAAAPSGADATISNLPDPRGETPLHTAAMLGHGSIAELLISHGGQMSTRDAEGKNAIHLSSVGGHLGCLALMLDQGGDDLIEARDSAGNSALHLAAEYGHLQVAKLLLETAANPSVRNGKGHTPYAIASAKGHHQVGILLLEYSSSSGPAVKRSANNNANTNAGKNFGEFGLGPRATSDTRAQLEQERLRHAAFGTHEADDDSAGSGGAFTLDVQEHLPLQRSQLKRQHSHPGPAQGSFGLPRPHTSSNVSSPSNAFPRNTGNTLMSPLSGGGKYVSNQRRGDGGMHSARDYDQPTDRNDLYNPMTARERSAPSLFEGLQINRTSNGSGSSNGSNSNGSNGNRHAQVAVDRQYSGSPGGNVVNGDRDMAEYFSYVQRNDEGGDSTHYQQQQQQHMPFSSPVSSTNRNNQGGDFFMCPPDTLRSPSPQRGMRTPVQQQHHHDYSSDQYSAPASYAVPLEEFKCLGHHWQLFQTDEGYYYYLIEASGHSQWDDPRTHGYQDYTETQQDYTDYSAAPVTTASPLKSPPRQDSIEEMNSKNVAFKQPKGVFGKNQPVERVKHVRALKRAPKKIELDVTPTDFTPDMESKKGAIRKSRSRNMYDPEDDDAYSSDHSFSTDGFDESKRGGILSGLRQQSSLDELRSTEKNYDMTPTDDSDGYLNGEVPEIRLVERRKHSPAKLEGEESKRSDAKRKSKRNSADEYFADVSGFVRRNLAPMDLGSEEEEEEVVHNLVVTDPSEILDIDGIATLEDNLLIVPSPEKDKSNPHSPGKKRSSPSVEDIKHIGSYYRQSSDKHTPRSRAKMAIVNSSNAGDSGPLGSANSFETTRGTPTPTAKPVYSDEDDDNSDNFRQIIEGAKNALPPRYGASAGDDGDGSESVDWDATNNSRNEGSDWDEDTQHRTEPLFQKRVVDKLEEDVKIVHSDSGPEEIPTKGQSLLSNNNNVKLAPIKPKLSERELLRERQFSSDEGGYGNGGNLYDTNLDKNKSTENLQKYLDMMYTMSARSVGVLMEKNGEPDSLIKEFMGASESMDFTATSTVISKGNMLKKLAADSSCGNGAGSAYVSQSIG